ncbi:MAG: hypothetical protein SAK29_18205 [Scytonema sp. PMC 1069.18]|nr:hypothetical protein [Scytonema sp. PMC 1069.18]
MILVTLRLKRLIKFLLRIINYELGVALDLRKWKRSLFMQGVFSSGRSHLEVIRTNHATVVI